MFDSRTAFCPKLLVTIYIIYIYAVNLFAFFNPFIYTLLYVLKTLCIEVEIYTRLHQITFQLKYQVIGLGVGGGFLQKRASRVQRLTSCPPLTGGHRSWPRWGCSGR